MATIGVDIDEVLFPCASVLAKWHERAYGTQPSLDDLRTHNYKTDWGWSDELMDEAHAAFQPGPMMAIPIDNSLSILRRLGSLYGLKNFTNRPVVPPADLREGTRSQVSFWFRDIFSELIFCEEYPEGKRDKGSVAKVNDIDLVIDDHLVTCNNCAEMGLPAIVFGDYAWNHGTLHPNVRMAVDWTYVPALVRELV